MLGRHVYRVHATDELWSVTKEGEDKPRRGFPQRDKAIAEARRLAKADQPSKVIIDDGDGKLTDEEVFGIDPGEAIA
jgi:hypothetical protein